MREHLSEAAHRLALHMGNYVTVGVERYRDPGVTEDPLEDLGVLAGLQPERCERVPQVVEANVGEVCALEERLEVPRGEVVAVHRPAVQRWEDEILVPGLGLPGGVPDLRVAQPLFEVPEPVRLQC